MSYGGSHPAYATSPSANGGDGRGGPPVGTPYAIDFSAQAVGKTVAATKRRVRWRWGFANQEALGRGEKGPACRGEEHDITMVWSITSGKRQVTMDGKEVHYGVSKGGKLEFSWTAKGNNVLKILAFANPPMSAQPRFRQYDLQINGQSFFEFPRMYELGMPRGSRAPVSSGYHAPAPAPAYAGHDDIRYQEEADIQRAIQASLQETHRKSLPPPSSAAPAPPPAAPPASDLLDFASGDLMAAPNPTATPTAYAGAPSFASPPPQPPTPSYGAPPPAQAYGAPSPAYSAPPPAPGAIVPAYAPAPGAIVPIGATPPNPYAAPPGYGAPPPNPYAAAPPNPYAPAPPSYASPAGTAPGQYDNTLLSPSGQSNATAPPPATAFPFGAQQPVPPVDDPFAPKQPTKNEIHSAILGAYAPTDGAPPQQPMTPNGIPPQPNFQSPPGAFPPQQQQIPYTNGTGGHAQSLSMAPLALNEQKNENISEVDSALQNLVNFDDISAPAAKDLKLTMVNQEEERKKKVGKSSALPPVANNMVGSGATLQQIQKVKPELAVKDPTKIMKPPPQLFSADAVNAGALVVHGQGPPPLQPQGFGAGFRNNYY